MTDWVNGWVGEGKGRLYRFTHDSAAESANGVANLLAGGIQSLGQQELFEMLSHADRRVRQESQFELVRRKSDAELLSFLETTSVSIAQRHAIWGLWQTCLKSRDDAARVIPQLAGLLSTLKGEEQIQAIRVITDLARRYGPSLLGTNADRSKVIDTLRSLLNSSDLRAAGFAATACGEIGGSGDTSTLLAFLDQLNNADPVARHQAVMGLVRLCERYPGLAANLLNHPGAAGRSVWYLRCDVWAIPLSPAFFPMRLPDHDRKRLGRFMMTTCEPPFHSLRTA